LGFHLSRGPSTNLSVPLSLQPLQPPRAYARSAYLSTSVIVFCKLLRSSLHFGQWNRKWNTDSVLALHVQAADSSTPMRANVSLSGACPVLSLDRIPASSRLSKLYTLVMCLFGRALSIVRVNLPTWSLSKSLIFSSLIYSLLACRALDFRRGPLFSTGVAFLFVALRVHWWAILLPLIPSCAGTYCRVTVRPWLCSCLDMCQICCRRYCLLWYLGLRIDCIAAKQSVRIVIWLVNPLGCALRICRVLRIAASSAAYSFVFVWLSIVSYTWVQSVLILWCWTISCSV
jgi:hypothetical protein